MQEQVTDDQGWSFFEDHGSLLLAKIVSLALTARRGGHG
jgi:hypothetical protein